jgi:hypothetical protein
MMNLVIRVVLEAIVGFRIGTVRALPESIAAAKISSGSRHPLLRIRRAALRPVDHFPQPGHHPHAVAP